MTKCKGKFLKIKIKIFKRFSYAKRATCKIGKAVLNPKVRNKPPLTFLMLGIVNSGLRE
jgi:hypothetical protein